MSVIDLKAHFKKFAGFFNNEPNLQDGISMETAEDVFEYLKSFFEVGVHQDNFGSGVVRDHTGLPYKYVEKGSAKIMQLCSVSDFPGVPQDSVLRICYSADKPNMILVFCGSNQEQPAQGLNTEFLIGEDKSALDVLNEVVRFINDSQKTVPFSSFFSNIRKSVFVRPKPPSA